jgi:hypothetical protein
MASACLAASACGTRMCSSTRSAAPRHVAAARLTPASLIAAATRARAPGSFSISIARSNGIAVLLGPSRAPALSQIARPRQRRSGRACRASVVELQAELGEPRAYRVEPVAPALELRLQPADRGPVVGVGASCLAELGVLGL